MIQAVLDSFCDARGRPDWSYISEVSWYLTYGAFVGVLLGIVIARVI